jgi:acetyl-CoA carboxylase biotin carboxyl carrier protein
MSRNILGIFDGGDVSDISALIDKLEKSSFDYMKLEGDGISVVIGKNGAGEFGSVAAPITAPATAPVNVSFVSPASAAAASPAVEAAESSVRQSVAEQEGIVLVKSPNYGLFYAQSEPGAPPYVKVGDTVKAGDTVGLLETMKTFTAISSPAAVEVVAIHVKNEEMLEPDQPLVSIKV